MRFEAIPRRYKRRAATQVMSTLLMASAKCGARAPTVSSQRISAFHAEIADIARDRAILSHPSHCWRLVMHLEEFGVRTCRLLT